MSLLFFNSSAWRMILGSDFATKIILICLALTSLLCVALIIAQSVYLFFVKKASALSATRIFASRSTQELMSVVQKSDALEAHLVRLVMKEKEGLGVHKQLNQHDFDFLMALGDHQIDTVIAQLETYLPTLGISGAVSPLIGLFGTVWGLIHAFMNISNEKAADIAVIAPGIAEALFTTLAGLVVAIPALIFFHYFSNQIRMIEWHLRQALDLTLLLLKKECKEE
jgi:biopolymer transport protein ExbB/TolQ